MMGVPGFLEARIFVGVVTTTKGTRMRLELEDDNQTLFDVREPAAGRCMTKIQAENLIEALTTMVEAWGGDGE